MLNKLSLPGPDSKYKLPDAQPAGFWAGVWHGVMAPTSFIISLFKPGVSIYETNNVGRMYNFGFILGAAMAFPKKQVIVRKNGKTCDTEDEDEEDEEEEAEEG